MRERVKDAARPRVGARLLGGRRRVALVWFAVLFGLASLWTVASPLFSGPDEPDHVIRAESVIHGQLVGDQTDPPNGGWRIVQAPDVLRLSRQIVGCFAFEPDRPACGPALEGSTERTPLITRAGAAPPLYYALTGVPVWLDPTGSGVYMARLLSNAIASALLAVAFTLATSRGGSFTMVGLLVGVTPMVLFLNGVVNPSSLEIAAAALVWVAGLVLVDPTEADGTFERVTFVSFVIGAVLLVLSRPLSPLWMVLICGALALTSTPRRLRALIRRRDVCTGLGVVAATAVAALAWLRIYRPLQGDNIVPSGLSGLSALRVSFERLGTMWRQIVGVFGWLDAPSPVLVVVVWCAVLVSLVLVALATSPSMRRAMTAAIVVAVFVPPLIQATQLDTSQPIWQGRYTLPLALGIPVLAGWALDRGARRVRDRLQAPARLAVAAMAVGQLVAFYFALRRYVVGSSGPIWFFGREQWVAPIAPSVLVFAFATMCGVLVTLAARTLAAPAPRPVLVPIGDELALDLDERWTIPAAPEADELEPADDALVVDGTTAR